VCMSPENEEAGYVGVDLPVGVITLPGSGAQPRARVVGDAGCHGDAGGRKRDGGASPGGVATAGRPQETGSVPDTPAAAGLTGRRTRSPVAQQGTHLIPTAFL